MTKKNEAFLIVSTQYPPHIGGVETYSYEIAGRLMASGYDTFVLTSEMPQENNSYTDRRGVNVIRVPVLELIGGRMPVCRTSPLWTKLRKRLDGYERVNVIIQTVLYPMQMKALKKFRGDKYRQLAIVHGADYVCLGDGIVDRLENIYEKSNMKKAALLSDAMSAVSVAGCEFLRKNGIGSDRVFSNSIDYEEMDSIKPEDRDSNKVRFIYTGRLIREKGIYQMMEAFERILKKYSEAELLVLGDGPCLEDMKKHACESIIVTGRVDHDELVSRLKSSDCLIMPSDSEGFSLSVLEALACGVYPIVSPYGAMKEIVGVAGSGTVMKDNTMEDIFDAMIDYMDNIEEYKITMKQASGNVRETYSWDKTVKDIIKYFDE